jgi:hypothetical protein
VLKSGVRLFGGFAGTETRLGQRVVGQNTSILSGDIGLRGDSTDNAYTVLYMLNPDSNTVLDGFTLERGNADFNTPGPTRVPEKCGGALYIMAADGWAYGEIRHCIFQYNYAYVHGGAVFINGAGLGSVAPRFTHCVFRYNQARVKGGGLFKDGASWVERAGDFRFCDFYRNTAGSAGGGLYIADADRSDRHDVEYCTFDSNMVGNITGGGSGFGVGRLGGSRFRLFGCRYTNNLIVLRQIDGEGTALSTENLLGLETKLLEIDSCYVDGSMDTLRSVIIFEGIGGDCKVSNSVFVNCRVTGFNQDKVIIDHCKFLTNNGIYYQHIFATRFTLFRNNYVVSPNVEVGIRQYTAIENCVLLTPQARKLRTFDTPGKSERFYNNLCYLKSINDDPCLTTLDVRNCIIFDTDGGVLCAKGVFQNCVLNNTDCMGMDCQQGNLFNTDPMFRDAAKGDYALLPCSPLIDAGTNTILPFLAEDIAGRPRRQGKNTDIGPYETAVFQAAQAPSVQAACIGTKGGKVSFHFKDVCTPVQYQWQNTIGASGTDTTGLEAGDYRFFLTDGRGLRRKKVKWKRIGK